MPRAKEGYTLRDVYKFYKERQRKKGKKVLPERLFKQIAHEWNKGIVDMALEGYHVSLPFRMGVLRIAKRKTNLNKPKLDYKHWKETGEKVFHLNNHSDGWYGLWHWTKYSTYVPNVVHYMFSPTFTNSKACSAIFFEPNGHKRFST